MPLALYRTYRPKTFAELIGQDSIRTALLNQLSGGRTAHAYLFAGPRGIGKTTTARLVARAINCKSPKNGEPDNTCEFCKEILDQRSLDIIEIDAASHTGVDHVREHIIENARFTPQRLTYKVFVIDEVHMLSTSAFNALLKTLEEPPEHALFILATTEIHRVPETIISRCQRFDFKRIGIDDLVQRLEIIAEKEGVKINNDVLRSIARRANGASRDAEVLLSQLLALGEKKITRDHADLILPRSDSQAIMRLLHAIHDRNVREALQVVNTISDEGVNMSEFITELIEIVRKMLVAKVTGELRELERGDLDDEIMKELPVFANDFSLTELTRMIELFIERRKDIKSTPLPQLPLELAIVELASDVDSNDADSQTPPPTVSNIHKESAPTKSEKKITKPKDVLQAVKSVVKKSIKKDGSPLSLENIRTIWPSILDDIRKDHRGLYLVLRSGKPVEVDGSIITIGFPYKLLADQARSAKSRILIEEIFQAKSGNKIGIDAKVVSRDELQEEKAETAQEKKEEKTPAKWDELLESFGGEVVGEE
ncbi:DNA polymerase III subunit gamma/tau [Patescibacteria group bacterium]